MLKPKAKAAPQISNTTQLSVWDKPFIPSLLSGILVGVVSILTTFLNIRQSEKNTRLQLKQAKDNLEAQLEASGTALTRQLEASLTNLQLQLKTTKLQEEDKRKHETEIKRKTDLKLLFSQFFTIVHDLNANFIKM